MLKNYPKAISVLVPIALLEFSVILAWFWMTGDFEQIRFGVWPMSEWLINYQAGFVRRGLIGELIYQLGGSQPLIPLLNHLTFYFFLSYCLILSLVYWLARIQNALLLTIAILIPGGIFQMAITASFFTRKEILFLILLGLLCFIYLRSGRVAVHLRKPWLVAFMLLTWIGGALLTLTHEAYLFMGFPYAVSLFWVIKKENPGFPLLDKALKGFVILIPSVFLLCTVLHGDVTISQQIWDSLPLADRLTISPSAPYTVYGAIGGIGWGKLQNLSTLYGVFATGGWAYWLLFGLGNYCVLAYLMLRLQNQQNTSQIPYQNRFLTLISLPLCFSLLMLAIGSDWGRWIASASNHVILLAFTLTASQYAQSKQLSRFHLWPQQQSWLSRGVVSGVFLFLILTYELIFELPECCVQFPYIFIQYGDFAKALKGVF